MAIEIYLNFNGNCKEAVEFYADCFNVERQKMMTFGEGPQNEAYPLPVSAKNLILHTFLIIQGSRIMFSDTFPGSSFVQGNNLSLTVLSKSPEENAAYFAKLKKNGTVLMDLQETFFSPSYAMIKDQFGVHWQLSVE